MSYAGMLMTDKSYVERHDIEQCPQVKITSGAVLEAYLAFLCFSLRTSLRSS